MILEGRLKKVSRLLSLFSEQIRTDVAMGFLDKNRVAEDILIPLFAVVYSYDLKNLNEDGENFPSIDLGDETAGVAFQISSEVDSAKIKDTLQKFIKYGHYEKFNRLIFYDLIGKQSSYAGTGWNAIIGDKFSFSKDEDIRDHTDVAAAIRRLPLEKVEKVQTMLEAHFGDVGDVSIPTPTDPVRSLHQLRPTLADFTGRENETNILKKAVTDGRRILGLQGIGGVGKTELAIALANELAGEFPDAQMFSNLQAPDGQPRPVDDVLSECIQSFLGTASESNLPRNREQLTKLFQSVFHGKKGLILLDNADDAEQIINLIPNNQCLVIITSRSPIPIPGNTTVELEIFSPAETRQLITSICPRVDVDQANLIGDLCAHLPLAVRAAGSLLAVTPDLDAGDYVVELQDERVRLEKIGAMGVKLGVAATFNLSYRKLPPESAATFHSLSVFPDWFAAEAATYVASDPEHKNLSDLVRRSLVAFDPKVKRYGLHPLVRIFATEKTNDDERNQAEFRFGRYFFELSKKANRLFLTKGSQDEGIKLLDKEKENVVRGFEIARNLVEHDRTRLELTWSYLVLSSQIFLERFPPEIIIGWAEHVLDAALTIGNESATLGPLTVLGLSYHSLGDLDRATKFFERSIEVAKRVDDNQSLAHALDYLGRVYNDKGQPYRAIELFKESKDTFHRIDRHFEEGRPMTDLALAYAQIGDTNAAISYLDLVVNEAREGGMKFEEANGLANLAIVWQPRSMAKTAELAEEAARIYLELGFHIWVAKALSQAAAAHISLGEIDQGFDQLDKAEEALGTSGDLFPLAFIIGKRGNALVDLNRLDEALVQFDRQLELGRKINSLEAQSNALGSKCIVFRKKGCFSKAESAARAALEIDRKSGNLQNQFITLCHLGESYLEAGDDKRALKVFEEQLELTKIQGYGKNALHSYKHVADTLLCQGKSDKALESLAESVEWAKTTPDPHDHAAALFQLAEFELTIGKRIEAASHAAESGAAFRAIQDEPCALKTEAFLKMHGFGS
jgi:tetratricopeptide (TPR) repeat protein